MPYKLHQTVYRAEVRAREYEVRYEEYIVVKVTPAGAWIAHPCYQYHDPEDLRKHKISMWIPEDAKFASTSKRKAKERLKARVRSHLRHEYRRMKRAEHRAKVLGILKPTETADDVLGPFRELRVRHFDSGFP